MALREITPELIAHYESTGAWQKSTLLQTIREHADRSADKVAVIDAHRDLTYAQLLTGSNAFARWLLDHGLASGDVVAIQVPSRIASVGRVVEEGGCRLVDESMSDVPASCVGEVIWRDATKSLGYLNDPVRTDEAF